MPYKVLVVDDEVGIRYIFNEFLKKESYAVKCVSSGEEALDLINRGDFDVVLLDIILQGMSGLEVLKKIKDIKPNLPVVMITGFGYDEELIAKSRELGCCGYLSKNIPISDIISNFKLLIKTAQESVRKQDNPT